MATDTPDSVVCACVQISSGPDRARNIAAVREGLDAAAARGAQIVALPEAVDLLDPDVERMRSLALRVDQHPAVRAFSEDARRLALWISVGSVTARNAHDEVVNRSVLLDPSGAIACEYDKIHLFDASIAGPESQGESAIYTRGHEGRLGATPWGLLGLTICYDLRFPHLFRALAQAGATLFMVPSGFLRVTGEAHWHVLLRARAIENGAFVIAAGQCGSPYPGRHDYGHSLIVDPWGRVLAEAGDQPAVIVAELRLTEIAKCRQAVPSLSQDQTIRVVQS